MATYDGPAPLEDRADRRRSGPLTPAARSINAEIPTKELRRDLSVGETSHKEPRWTGCPAGCGKWHECGIGGAIDINVDYSLSPIFVGNPLRLSDLRTTGVAA